MEYKPLTIFGQMVMDHVVHVNHPHESANLKGKALDWDPTSGKIIINENAVISTPYTVGDHARRLLFSLKPGEYKSGSKIDAMTEEMVDKVDEQSLEQPNLSKLGFPRSVPGGGGTNVCYALYKIFRNIQKRYAAVCSKLLNADTEGGLAPLFPPSGLSLLKNDPGPAVNIIIEGIAGDRFIIRSPIQRDIPAEYHERTGDICMVNSCPSWFTALNGLIEILKARKGGVIACTAALCDDTQIPNETGAMLAQIARKELGDFKQPTVDSIHSFIRNEVMKRANNFIYIFNEMELAHFIKECRDIDVLDLDKDALFSGIVRALRWLRGVQAGAKPEVVVTLGTHGALYLDKDDALHYCRTMTDREMQRVAGEKNAIGDLFAAMVLGVHYGRGERGIVAILGLDGSEITKSHVPSLLIAASAAADDGVYNGFMNVTPTYINSLIQMKVNHYSFLGSIYDIDPRNYVGKVGKVFEQKIDVLRKCVIKESCTLGQLVDRNLLTP
jgi:hypothetical protein